MDPNQGSNDFPNSGSNIGSQPAGAAPLGGGQGGVQPPGTPSGLNSALPADALPPGGTDSFASPSSDPGSASASVAGFSSSINSDIPGQVGSLGSSPAEVSGVFPAVQPSVPSGGDVPQGPSGSAPNQDLGSQESTPAGVPSWASPVAQGTPSNNSVNPSFGSFTGSNMGGVADSQLGSQGEVGSSPFPSADPVPTFTPPPAQSGTNGSVGNPDGELSSALNQPGTNWPISSSPSWPPATPLDAGTPPEPVVSPPAEPEATESVPTDLSHLVGNSSGNHFGQSPSTPVPDTLTTAPSPDVNGAVPVIVTGDNTQHPEANQAMSQAVTSTSGGFPKWILLAGGLVLLVVVAASAHFILGIGQQTPQASVPVEQPPLTAPPISVLPSPTIAPAILPPPPTSPSASFGNLQGTTPTPISSPSAQTGASALDLLRQRQTSGR